MASGLLDVVNSVIGAAAGIPYTWDELQLADRSRKDKLFQLVRMWNDQINRSKNGSGYSFEAPACFIEIRDMSNTMLLDGVSLAEYVFRFHIVAEELDAGDDTNMDQNLSVIGYRDAVKQTIVGFQPPQCSTLFTINEEQDYAHDDVYHYILDFKCSFTDTKGSNLDPDQTKVIRKDNIPQEINLGFGNPPVGVDPLILEITPS